MAFANTEDPWIDYLIISRLGGCYATPIVQFFQDGRFRIKIDPQLESATQPKARGLLHMECDFATALPYNLDFKTDEYYFATFQPRGSSSTIEDFSKQYSRTLKNYSKRLHDYSNYYSRLQRARGLVRHTPRVPMQGRMKTDSY
jgi:hypothetical protein